MTSIVSSAHRALARVRGRKQLVGSAGVRIVGAILLLVSVSLGIRLVGTTEFGIAMLAIAIGQIAAFPITSLDRLVIRLAATGRVDPTRRILHLSTAYSGLIVVVTVAAATWSARSSWSDPVFVSACGLVALTTSQLIVRQGLNRAQGRLGWGQVPNEIVRPSALIAGFAAVNQFAGSSSGSVAVLIAYTVTIGIIVLAPAPLPRATVPTATPATTTTFHRPMLALVVVAAIAMIVERGLTVGLGALADPDQITRYTIVLRVIQIAMFAQIFGVFFFSPQIARLHALGEAGRTLAISRVRHIRLIGLASAVPTALVCLVFPGAVSAIMGTSMDLTTELAWTALAVMAQMIAGTTQAYLAMAGYEHVIALSSAIALAVGAVSLAALGPLTAASATAAAAIHYVCWAVVMLIWCRVRLGRLI